MKKQGGRILTILVMLAAGISISVPAQQMGVTAPLTPRAVCVNPVWDFGRVVNTNQVEHVFELSNEGLAPLKIQRVSSGCGCTAVQTGADRIEPGRQTQVTVHFNPAGRTGPQRKGVYVHTNDPEKPVLHLEMTGEVLEIAGLNGRKDATTWNGIARVMPERVNFGQVKTDAVVEGWITLKGASSNDVVHVAGVETGMKNLEAKMEGSNGECRVELRLVPGLNIGPGAATVTIRTSHPVLKTVNVPVTWKTVGDLYAIPEEITVVTGSSVTNPATRYVAIRSRKGIKFHLEGVVSDGADLETELSPMTGDKGFLLKVSGISPETNGTARMITVHGGDGSQLTIPIHAVISREGS